VTGYLHREYAESLSEFGTPRELPGSQGWILERDIAGTDARDAMGGYPLFACRDWPRLKPDLDGLDRELVSLVVVSDPFGDYTEAGLRDAFRDLVVPFKKHFVVDLRDDPDTFIPAHHRRNVRKALASVRVENCDDVPSTLSEWASLYRGLIKRHSIHGISRFSDSCFEKQLRVPGAVMFRAIHERRTVGMVWWFVSGPVGYYHLGAYSQKGYDLGASFALFWEAIRLFKAEGLRWLNLGAGAGLGGSANDGLSRFKRGWSNATRTAYLCGRIFDRSRYDEIALRKGIKSTGYFPAYRQGEFT